MELTCPKCQGPMRSYERNGVTVDQCGECRGIFLDRGELERLMDAEAAFNSAPAAPPQQQPAYGSPQASHPQRTGHRYDEDRHRDNQPHGHDDRDYNRKKKRKSFLEDLFE